jgi:hypothetical protein
MAYRDDLIIRRDRYARELATLEERNLALPNATGQTLVDYERHADALIDRIAKLDEMIAAADPAWESMYEGDT